MQPGYPQPVVPLSSVKPTTEQLEQRYLFHPVKGDQGDRYERIRTKICTLAKELVMITPAGREQSVALTHLDDAMFNFQAAIARGE